MSNRAIFLDRDGTVIHDLNYPRDPDRVRLVAGVGEALARLRDHGFFLVIVSTQSGVGRGLITSTDVRAVHERMVELLTPFGVFFDASEYCLHAPWEECACRKPSPLMLERAAEQLQIDLRKSFMVGDRGVDVETGRNAGCRTILIHAGKNPSSSSAADLVAPTWEEAVRYILALEAVHD